jgi:hypothetical protein
LTASNARGRGRANAGGGVEVEEPGLYWQEETTTYEGDLKVLLTMVFPDWFVLVSYSYDSRGRLVLEEGDDNGDGSVDSFVATTYDADDHVAELETQYGSGSGRARSGSTTTTATP